MRALTAGMGQVLRVLVFLAAHLHERILTDLLQPGIEFFVSAGSGEMLGLTALVLIAEVFNAASGDFEEVIAVHGLEYLTHDTDVGGVDQRFEFGHERALPTQPRLPPERAEPGSSE